MKIIILSSVDLDSGTGLRMSGLAKALAKLGHEVYLTGSGLYEDIRPAVYLGLKKKRGLKKIISLILANIKFLKKDNYDVIIASKAHPASCIPVLLYGKRVKKILDFDDLEHAYWKNPIKRYFFELMEKVAPRFFDYVTTHNENLKNYITAHLAVPEKKIIMLQQGIDLGILKKYKKRRIAEKKTIVYAAHLGPAASDLDIIFEAMKNIKNANLVVIGHGTKFSYYQKMVKKMGLDNVFFVGSVKHGDIAQYLSAADAAVNFMRPTPANLCRASIKIREYLAFGIPTASNIVGSDMKTFKKYLYVINDCSPKGVENALRKALNDSEKKSQMGKKYMKRWSWDKIVASLEKKLLVISKS